MARNRYPEETKNLIIDTAARLFIEKGYEHTSIQDIINDLGGLSKGAIYHHFKSKDEIMQAVADKLYYASSAAQAEACARKDLNGKEKLEELFRLSASNPAQKEMFSAAPDMLKNPQLLVMFLRDTIQHEATEMVKDVILEGIKDGSIQTEYPKQMAEVVMLLGNFWLNPLIYQCGPAEMLEKLKFYRHILKLLGLDIIDDKMIGQLEEYAHIYQQSKPKE